MTQNDEANSPGHDGLSQRAHRAAGQPISHLMHRALAQPELISLAAGFVDSATLPAQPTRVATEALLRDPVKATAALQYGTTAGHAPLREAVLDRILEADGQTREQTGLNADRVVITSGSNQLLHLLIDTLCEPGDVILCPAPTYFVFIGLLANLGVRAVGVDVDDDGMIPDALEEQLARLEAAGERSRVKGIYTSSYFENPSGLTLSRERREQIVAIAKQRSTSAPNEPRIHVLEDAAYRELRYYGQDTASIRSFDDSGDTVVYAGTFSKSFSPGIRVGWGILPPHLVEPVCNQKGNIDFGSPNFSQYVMTEVLAKNLLDPHVERLRDSYRKKLVAMLEAADEHFAPLDRVHWIRPQGGLYVWLTLPEELDAGPDGPLLDRALDEGVLYVPGGYCFAAEGAAAQPNTIRLSFGVQTETNIRTGIEKLAHAISECMDELS